MGRNAAAEHGRERAGEADRVALDRDVDVEARLTEEDVPDRPADDVHPVGPLAERRHGLEERAERGDSPQLVGEALRRLLRPRLDSFERAEEIGSGHDPDELLVAERPRRGRPPQRSRAT